MVRICVFADSIGWGDNDYSGGGWVEMLRRSLFSQGKASVYNLSVCGDTTRELLARFEAETRARTPQAIVFSIGTNDSIYFSGDRKNANVCLSSFEANLRKIISLARKVTSKIAFVGLNVVDEARMMPSPWDPDAAYDNVNIRAYDGVIRRVCQEKGVLFVHTLGLLDEADLDDGLHPSSAGHQKLYAAIGECLGKNLL